MMAVITDPAGRADFAASDDDYLVASGLLSGVVSGLVSRLILNDAVVGAGDFHACVTYPQHAEADLSSWFVNAVAPPAAAADVRSIAGHEKTRHTGTGLWQCGRVSVQAPGARRYNSVGR